MKSVDNYIEVKDCVYKDEHYSVRDNGSIMRHQREGMRKRKNDEVWSFGTPNLLTGYMEFCAERVHRIVATAFHGPAPSSQHVVDHIDTNRQNNRPENLHWVTKLENILNNPITRAKIEYICGSIDAFLENPTLLYGHETEDKNFSWMRNVTPEEAKISYENFLNWVKEHPEPKGGSLGEWVFKEQKESNNSFVHKPRQVIVSDDNQSKGDRKREYIVQHTINNPNDLEMVEYKAEGAIKDDIEPLETQSLTPNAIQLNWKYPVNFPCCPQQFTGNPLEAYMANLKEGKLFSTNDWGDSTVLKFGMPQPECLWVMCAINIGFKSHAFTKITFKKGVFYHENKGVYDIGDEPEEMFESILNGKFK